MNLGLVGINHRTAEIALRERVARDLNRFPVNLLKSKGLIKESALISTCNRAELIFATDKTNFESARCEVISYFNRSSDELSSNYLTTESIYSLRDEEVPRHIYRVSTGLDSMILGESQILSQLKKSYFGAVKNGWIGSNLHRLFQGAFHTAKKVRTNTGIGRGTLSVAFAAKQAVSAIFSDVTSKKVLIIGAGETSRLVGKHLQGAGAETFFVANRSRSRGESLSKMLNGISITLDQIAQIIPLSDIVVCAIDGVLENSSGQYLVSRETIRKSLEGASRKIICLLDLSVPRAFDPCISEIENAYLFDIDDFGGLISDNLLGRKLEAERAKVIIDEEASKFVRWQSEREIRKTLAGISEELLACSKEEIVLRNSKLSELIKISAGSADPGNAKADIEEILLKHQRNVVRRFLHPYFERLEIPEL
ncbi:MAG TPA: glutamyl-tRNA reductase [Oligoflexia bacterium]|nr:glutamyl-tRNA reductase [Oligoflexia bacterium]HMP48087.1 glutamyl-tRNA reductase [Oligoflexia bacterium]